MTIYSIGLKTFQEVFFCWNRSIVILILLSFGIGACSDEDLSQEKQVINESDEYAVCNSMLMDCVGGTGDYCLFGFKWGGNPIFSPTGYNTIGPREAGGVVSFSFQEE